MIDSEPVIFDYVSKQVKGIYGEKFLFANTYRESSAEFPFAFAIEIANSVYEKVRTTNIENAQKVVWEVQVFSNLAVGAKFQAKEIMSIIDAAFSEIGFTRTMMEPVPNFQNPYIYRILARYTGIVDKDLWIYTQ